MAQEDGRAKREDGSELEGTNPQQRKTGVT